MSDANADAEARAALAEGRRRDALSILMRAYGRDVYGRCRAITGDDATADDVRQKVFIAAWQGLEGYEGRSSMRTWLLGIARNKSLDALRRRRAQIGTPTDDGGDAVRAVEAGPDAFGGAAADVVLGRVHAAAVLDACLATLTPQCRMAVVLRYMEGMPFAEMARLCREPAKTLQSRALRAMEPLRRCLAARGVTP